MGNCMHKKVECQQVMKINIPQSNIFNLTSVSVSNPSLKTIDSDEDLEEAKETGSDVIFTLDHMDELYQQYKEENKIIDQITETAIKAVTHMVDAVTMDEHILFVGYKYMEGALHADENYIQSFANCAILNVNIIPEHLTYTMEQRCILHSLYVLRMFKVIIATFDDGKEDKAYEILNLIALSHVIMKADSEEFMKIVYRNLKSLLIYNLITEEQLPHTVYLLRTFVGYIVKAMKTYKKKSLKYDSGASDELFCRENYRELKKWKALVQNLRRGLAKVIAQLERQTADGKNIIFDDDTKKEQAERWKIIEILKRGYKYREMLEDSIFKRKTTWKAKAIN